MQSPELVLDRYRVGGRLAAGAAGTVVSAVDTEDERQVVVKFFDGSDDNFAAWVQEMRLAMRLRHANIPRCLNAGHDPAWGLSVLVFERALGGSLRRALAGGQRFDGEACRRVLADVTGALVHAHAQGVIHRDIKPENILARESPGQPPWLLTDFGAGRFLPRGAIARAPAGSLLYMAPEVMTTGGVAASDQFSLGMVGVELRAGAVPDRRGRSQFRLRDGDGLDRLLARLIDPDPERRFPGIEAVAAALASACDFDVTGTRDGCHYALVGAEVLVRRPGRAALEHVGHLPGARAFVNAWGDGVAVVATEQRLVALSPFARTIGAAAPLATFVADVEQAALWCLDDLGVYVRGLAGQVTRAAVEVPPRWRGGGRLLGVHVGPGRAVLGARGSDALAWVERDASGARGWVERAPGPVHDLRRVFGSPVALCGDASTAVVAALGETGMREIARRAEGVDTLRVARDGAGLRVTSLVPVLACAGEDEA